MHKMYFPSFTVILSGVFIAYISYSIYVVSLLFTPPPCTDEKLCIKSYLSDRPKLQLNLFTSTMKRPLRTEVTNIYKNKQFDYLHESDIPLTIDIPYKTRQNGSLFLHIILSPQFFNPDGVFSKFVDDIQTVHTIVRFNEFVVPQAETFNLLGDDENYGGKKQKKKSTMHQPVSHIKSRLTFTIMTDDIKLPINDFPIELSNTAKITQDRKFLPLVHYNFLYTRFKDLVKITQKMHSTNVTVQYTPISIGKLRLILHLQAAMQNFKQLGFTDKDIDEIKGIFADTNLYLLAGTVFISAMHLLFDFLAFKNDISFWRSKSNLAGLSTQTVLWRAFSQAVIFLYLFDEGSSLLVLIPAGVGTIIELWKTKKILRAELVWTGGFLPRIQFNWSKCTSAETKTREFDAESMRYLSYLLYPLVILGAIYSLLYLPHKSWYSWCIHSLVNGVYAFGFLFMLPQLFVNYKLKSVAHLPWRSFMYKAFNTFIDDVFAFIITMPVAHRVACFRDDAVFLVYLYQRWLYPVDKSRIDSATIDEDPTVVDTNLQKKKR
ncbi:cleft lip and palate transmembrane protein 1-like protein [Nasonia vitripennis]|uniref:Lipid scramblase CLPTM1L n=1 Tax=Nasonia vitripennis TaxID=7425 RepID=A0A7M7H8P0_NASVI|nr:cleft lip and palate transmembrane protein 1-like protein [Nasonia vitripennis]XP_008204234.1 cleft lip and palate transmembrane protein 1-like protein [Nasonia vitripennis]